jgi:hypothetical protein
MKKISVFVLAAAVALLSSPASAIAWNELGAQQFAMGGAGVADAQGPLASYWNPAALGRPSMNSYGLAIPVDAEANLKGPVLAGAKDLSNCISNPSTCTQPQIAQAMGELNHSGEGLNVNAGAAGNLKIGKFTVFLHDFVDAGAQPYVDTVDCPPPYTSIGCVNNNKSSLIIRGANISELGLAYGHELPWTPGLYIGGALKVMRAEVGYENYSIASNNGFSVSDIAKNFKNNTQASGNFGVDVGALWDLDKTFNGAFWSPRLGVTGHNLNNPKFDYSAYAHQFGEQRYAVNPQWRTGLSFSPAHWWHFAADADLTKNITQLDNAPSQSIGVGTEIDIFNRPWINIPLRVGVKHNVADSNDGATYTLGTGINLLHLIIDVSGEYANQKVSTQSENGSKSLPDQLGAAVQISFLFGGADERHEHASAAEDQQISTGQNHGGDMNPSDADRVRADADKAQQELNNQSAPSGN